VTEDRIHFWALVFRVVDLLVRYHSVSKSFSFLKVRSSEVHNRLRILQ